MRTAKAKPVVIRNLGGPRTGAGDRATVRSDIPCGALGCPFCLDIVRQLEEQHMQQRRIEGMTAPGSDTAAADAATSALAAPSLLPQEGVAIFDAATVQSNIRALEHPTMQNVMILGSVAADVLNRNRSVGARLRAICESATKRCYLFSNEHHEATHSPPIAGETPADHTRRRVCSAATWLASHWATAFTSSATPPRVVVVTSDDALKAMVAASNHPSLTAASIYDYVQATYPNGGDGLLDQVSANSAMNFSGPGGSGAAWGQSYLPEAEVAARIAEGVLAQGRLRLSESSCFYGDVRGSFGSLKIFADGASSAAAAKAGGGSGTAVNRIIIAGRYSVNRAIHDDIVAVAIRPVAEWKAPDSLTAKRLSSISEAEALQLGCTPTGHVVAVTSPNRRPYCGSVDLSSNDAVKGSVIFQPKSARIPRMRLHTRNADELSGKRVVAVIDDWPDGSYFPSGHYIDILGPIGDKDTEAKVILMERDIPYYDFSAGVYDCLPKQWAVEDRELLVRKDFRHLPICSVDPLGCRDIDDALHFRPLGDGTVEVGVHIADVTHFVKENNAMDLEAQKRSTSVYLVDRRINMLPQLLTENLCSIVGNEDRYAFSFVWKMKPDTCEIVEEWFGKSVIRSRAALYYGDAQKMIDDPSDCSELTEGLRGLMRLSMVLKNQRLAKGALELESQQFKFVIDNDHVDPTDMMSYKLFDTNSMVEEWMLFANIAAAKACYKAFPQWALLRRHEQPDAGRFEDMNKALFATIGKTLDPTSSATLNASLKRCVHPSDPYFNTLIRTLTTRCLKQAQYFSSGDVPYDKFFHYGLAMPIYTHFTSPIRRYADVVVHRQLASIIGLDRVSDDHANVKKMHDMVDNINYRHDMAQKAGRDSQNLFTGFFLRSFPDGNIPDEPGYVIKMSDDHVVVFIPKYGQEGKVALDVDAPAETTTSEPAATVDGDAGPSDDTTNATAGEDGAAAAVVVQRVNPYTLLQRVLCRIRLCKDGKGDACAVKLQFSIVSANPPPPSSQNADGKDDGPLAKKRRIESATPAAA